MRLKKAAACLMAGMITLGCVTGCGANETGQNAQGSGAQSAADSAGSNSSENIILTMLYSGTTAENDFETMILPGLVKEAFPNITLEVTKLPDDQYYTALKTRLASGECPDIFLVQPMYAGSNSVIGLAKAGYLEPLSDMACIELIGGGNESFTYDGEIYGLATGISILGTYYNKDMFETNGLSEPTNWDEFLNCCETLKNAGIQPIVMGDKDMYVLQFGLYQLACSQIYAKDADFDTKLRTGETKYTDEGTWDVVLDMYNTLYANGYVDSNSLGLSAQQAIQKFIDGEAAMTFDGSFNLKALAANGAGGEFDRGYFPMPGNAAGEDIYAAVAPGAGPAIYSGSKYVAECKAILDLYYDGESEIWKNKIEEGKFIPTYGYGVDNVNPLYQPYLTMYNDGKTFYWSNQGWPAGVESEMEALFSEMIGGQGTTVADITKGMQMKFDELYTGD